MGLTYLESFLRKVKHQRGTPRGLKKAASDGVDRPQEPSSEDWEQPRGWEPARKPGLGPTAARKWIQPTTSELGRGSQVSDENHSPGRHLDLHPGEPPSKWPSSVGPRILMYRNWEIISGCSKLLNMWYSVTLNRKCIYQLPFTSLHQREEESHTLHVQKEFDLFSTLLHFFLLP